MPRPSIDPACSDPSCSYRAEIGMGYYVIVQDPIVKATAEALFEETMQDHLEPNGTYACDAHVILDIAIDALRAAAR